MKVFHAACESFSCSVDSLVTFQTHLVNKAMAKTKGTWKQGNGNCFLVTNALQYAFVVTKL